MDSAWRYVVRSVVGASHTADDTPCQDSSRVRVLEGKAAGTLVACVADGAGSAKHSAVGSLAACNAIVECVDAYLAAEDSISAASRETVIQWCDTARRRIEEEAAARDAAAAQFATTICVAVLSDSGSCFFQIGDGAIVLQSSAACGAVFWPESGEYINTTTFITSKEYRDRLRVHITEQTFDSVALLTDGIDRLALRFDSETPHSPFFAPLFQALRSLDDWQTLGTQLEKFLNSPSVAQRSDDDKTLILAVRSPSESQDA